MIGREELKALNYELICNYMSGLYAGRRSAPFPPPPLPPVPGRIEPVTTWDAMERELDEQNDSCAKGGGGVVSGDAFFYRVLDCPGESIMRSTLILRRNPGGVWVCSDLLGKCNACVNSTTWAFIRRWLESAPPGVASAAPPDPSYVREIPIF